MIYREMGARTLAALKESIAHWEENEKAKKGHEAKIFSWACPLCAIFEQNNCYGCPVSAKTGRPNCELSPWRDVCEARRFWCADIVGAEEKYRAACRDEIAFLKSLLPEGEQS